MLPRNRARCYRIPRGGGGRLCHPRETHFTTSSGPTLPKIEMGASQPTRAHFKGGGVEMKSGSRLEVISVPYSFSLLCLARAFRKTEN